MPGYDPKCRNFTESNKLHGFFFHRVIRIDARWCTWTTIATHRYHLNNDTFIASGHWQNARVKAGFSSCVKYWNLQRKRYTFSTLETKTFSLDLELEIWCCWMSPTHCAKVPKCGLPIAFLVSKSLHQHEGQKYRSYVTTQIILKKYDKDIK